MASEEIEKDESFEIISEKEKYWRDQLIAAETSYITAEANLAIADKVILLAKEEVAKEAKKNAK
jgi:hypothetical protein